MQANLCSCSLQRYQLRDCMSALEAFQRTKGRIQCTYHERPIPLSYLKAVILCLFHHTYRPVYIVSTLDFYLDKHASPYIVTSPPSSEPSPCKYGPTRRRPGLRYGTGQEAVCYGRLRRGHLGHRGVLPARSGIYAQQLWSRAAGVPCRPERDSREDNYR
jgi:hypothetical protein